jgi:sugar phosphate isomerase/epimerase
MTEIRLPLAVQLYSLRGFSGSLDEMLREVAAADYTGIETIGNQGCGSAAELQELLDRHGLTITSSHYSLEALQEDLTTIAEFQEAVGNHDLVVKSLSRHLYDDTKESWQRVGEQLDELGERCGEYGMRLHYHNHAFELIEIEGKLGLEWLLDSTQSQNLGFEIDLGWLNRGGVDPLPLLEKYAGRCELVHVKDVAAEGENFEEGGWADVGYGCSDWARLLPAVRAAGAKWYIVEHDEPRDPVATLRRSAGYLQGRL